MKIFETIMFTIMALPHLGADNKLASGGAGHYTDLS